KTETPEDLQAAGSEVDTSIETVLGKRTGAGTDKVVLYISIGGCWEQRQNAQCLRRQLGHGDEEWCWASYGRRVQDLGGATKCQAVRARQGVTSRRVVDIVRRIAHCPVTNQMLILAKIAKASRS